MTTAVGSILSTIRGDRILAIDVDPNGGNLVDRAAHHSQATSEHLLHDANIVRYHDIRGYTQMNDAGLEVLAAPDYNGARHLLSSEDWHAVTGIVAPYYNIILVDTGKGLRDPATHAALSTMANAVIVGGATTDGARQAAVTMNWLVHNGFGHLASRSCVVINHLVPTKPPIDVTDLAHQYERLVGPGRVVIMPWDKHVADGGQIQLDRLSRPYRRKLTELAAALCDDFTSSPGTGSAGRTAHVASGHYQRSGVGRHGHRHGGTAAVDRGQQNMAGKDIDPNEAIALYLKHYSGKNTAEFDSHYGPGRAESARALVIVTST